MERKVSRSEQWKTFHTSDSGTEERGPSLRLGQGGFSSSFDLWRAQVKASLQLESRGVSLPSPTDPPFHVESQKGSGWEEMPKHSPVQPRQSRAICITASAKGRAGAALRTRLPKTSLWSAARQSEGLILSFTGKGWPASMGTGREGCSGQTQYADYNSMPIVSASAMERSPAPSWPLAMPCSKADTEPRVCSICVQNKPCHVPRETTSILQQGTLRPRPFRKQDFNFNTFRDPLDTFFQRRSPPVVPPDPPLPTGEDQHLSLPCSSIRPQPQHLHVLTLLVVIKWSSW